ncbi:MAG TPA: hypothetical protein VIE65_06710 [Methylobacter sp.]|jgi:hypothetical protein
MNKQTRQLAAVITGQNTSDGAGVKLKRIVSQQQKTLSILLFYWMNLAPVSRRTMSAVSPIIRIAALKP